jgi:hypothetical protein
MNASHHEQIGSQTNFPKKKKPSRVTNGVSSNEHASRQQQLATSCKYRQESVSCCVIRSVHSTQNSFSLQTFRVTNGLQERIKFVNQGSTVQIFHIKFKKFE